MVILSLYSLDGNSITDYGAGMLADALKVKQSLQSLRSVAESSIPYIQFPFISRGTSLHVSRQLILRMAV